jgi:hypothetical protein
MTDDDFLAALEAGQLQPEQFSHAAHLRAAYCYLQREPFLEACIAMRNSLKAFAARIGKPGLYHETVTIAFMSLVAERMAGGDAGGSAAFVAQHPELQDKALMRRYYAPAVLESELARRCFVLGTGAASDGGAAP